MLIILVRSDDLAPRQVLRGHSGAILVYTRSSTIFLDLLPNRQLFFKKNILERALSRFSK